VKVFLDSDVVIYFVEQSPVWGARVAARITALRAAGESLVVSDLVRMECRVGPLRTNDVRVLGDFTNFFADPALTVVAVTSPICDRAAEIRATHGFKPLDALHLAAAVVSGCGLFLTHDAQLRRFPDITVEVLA
jgi:predicted nucleic acid-binding protein